MKPKLVLVITDSETNAQVKPLGVDFLELRVDLFKKRDPAYARRQFEQRRKLRIPLILTIRNHKKEGARKEFSDAQKWELLQALVPLADWVDVELSSPICARTVALVRQQRKKALISAHDFHRLPHLEQVLKKALSTRADMVKIAAQANSPQDLVRMVEFTHHHRKQPVVTMCMGPWGALSRLVLPAAGSRWAYTFLGRPTASGQVGVHEFKSHLKFYFP